MDLRKLGKIRLRDPTGGGSKPFQPFQNEATKI
jgi:hypothetical protein